MTTKPQDRAAKPTSAPPKEQHLSSHDFLFFGLLASRDDLDRAIAGDSMPQVSAVKLQTSLLEGLAAHNVTLRILGALPVSTYPRSKTLLVHKNHFATGFPKMSGMLMWDVNLPLLRLAVRSLTSLAYGAKVLAAGKGSDGIIVYPLHTPFLAAAICLKHLFKIPVFVFIPDLPMHTTGRSPKGLTAIVKGLNDRILSALAARVDFAFPITKDIATDWLPPTVRYLVVEGIAPSSQRLPAIRRREHRGRQLLYTGQFTHVVRFARLFASRRELDAKLVFVGDGAEQKELGDLAREDPRIVVKPFVTGAALEREFEASDFLINPRDTRWEGAKFSFPSKLLDYMARGLPILSTRIPSIPEEYFECFLEVSDEDADGLATTLDRAFATSEEELVHRIEVGETMLANSKSPEAVADRILGAIAEICGRASIDV